MDQASIDPHRRTPRSNVLMAATLECGGDPYQVKLRNLSTEGALVEGPKLPPVGSPVLFRKKELTMLGRVVWHEGAKAGIAFDGQLDRESVLRHIPAPKPLPKLDFRRPALKGTLSEGERKIAQDWIFGRPSINLDD